ncbi:MAG TPA: lamin tail domain-containing protein [Dongiaceae bacterium]|nr:lamin tail domain-containing protein [Dongiaceae bacterium]
MLKKISGLLLGLVVLASSACVTPTHASSAPTVIITSVVAATQGSAKEEMITLYNTTSEEIDITNWCLVNKSAVRFACFTYDDPTVHAFLMQYGYATIISENFADDLRIDHRYFSSVYTVTNQSSGSIVNSSDTISLIDAHNQVIDTKTWSSAIPTARVLTRVKLFSQPDTYATTGGIADWAYDVFYTPPENNVALREAAPESADVPEPEKDTSSSGQSDTQGGEAASPLLPLQITELLLDAEGSDINNEFVELFNPNNQSVSLADYKLLVGTSLEKSYQFPAGLTVEPGGYLAVYNNVVKYSLNNTEGKVGLSRSGKLVGESVSYMYPNEGETWALFDDAWSYTNQPTPGQPNLVSVEDDTENELTSPSQLAQQPCAANQYRSSETGRCRLLATNVAKTLTPCKDGQVRSAETNRCRAVASASTRISCAENQTRNPETGRCRAVKSMPKVGYGLKEAKTTQKSSEVSWYMWGAIGGVIAIIVGYGIWEWRVELRMAWERLITAILKK